MNEQSRPGVIGIFDSGIGGISILGRIREHLPNQPVVYLADQGNAPYGPQTLDQVRLHARNAARTLLGRGVDVIVIACNTASAAALYELRDEFVEVPFVGMEPAVKPAVAGSRARKIGVLATEATFQGELYANVVDRHAAGVEVIAQACPGLADLVERGELDGPRAIELVSSFVKPLVDAGVDTLVLGCTHYAFVADLISTIAGPGVEIIDPADAIAKQVGRVLGDRDLLGTKPTNDITYITTGDTAAFDEQLEWVATRLSR